MGVVKQLLLSLVLAAGVLVAWIAWMPEARPLLERAGLWPVLERSGALEILAAVGITPAGSNDAPAAGPGMSGGPPAGGPPAGGRPAGGPPAGGQSAGGAPGGPPGGRPGGFAMPAPTVIVAEVRAVERSATVSAIGTGQAVRSVAVTPEASGRMAEILVRPGQLVEAGDVLARLDAAAERIALDRAALMLEDARESLVRRTRLVGTGAASEVQIRDAELAMRTAELALAQAELELSRREITAPISGYVGFVPSEIGNQVTTSSEITRIDDRSVLLVDFLVPERHVDEIREGMPLTARPLSRAADALEGRVRAIDNRVDAASRSLSVQAEIENPGDRLRAGMAFAIELAFTGETLPAVDPLAIQWNRAGSFVWALRDGKVQRVPIRIVQRGSEHVLVEAALEPGDLVVREGVQTLRPGLEVQVRNGAPARESGAPPAEGASRGGAVSAPGAGPAGTPTNGRAAAAPAPEASPTAPSGS